MKGFLWAAGVLMCMCGIALATTPLLTFWETSYFFVVLLLVYGLGAIARSIAKREVGSNLLFGILSVIASFLFMFVPALRFMTSTTIIYIMAVWFLIQGGIAIGFGVQGRNKENVETKKWLGSILIGVLSVALGVYSLIQPTSLAFSVGLLIGIYFIVSGINLLVLGFQLDKRPKAEAP